jgi:hypothetical protein
VRRLLSAYRLTPAGGAIVFVLLAAVLVLLVGPRSDEGPAFVVIVVVLAICVISAVPAGVGRWRRKGLATHRAELYPRRRRLGDVPDPRREAEAMQRERELHEARERGEG